MTAIPYGEEPVEISEESEALESAEERETYIRCLKGLDVEQAEAWIASNIPASDVAELVEADISCQDASAWAQQYPDDPPQLIAAFFSGLMLPWGFQYGLAFRMAWRSCTSSAEDAAHCQANGPLRAPVAWCQEFPEDFPEHIVAMHGALGDRYSDELALALRRAGYSAEDVSEARPWLDQLFLPLELYPRPLEYMTYLFSNYSVEVLAALSGPEKRPWSLAQMPHNLTHMIDAAHHHGMTDADIIQVAQLIHDSNTPLEECIWAYIREWKWDPWSRTQAQQAA